MTRLRGMLSAKGQPMTGIGRGREVSADTLLAEKTDDVPETPETGLGFAASFGAVENTLPDGGSLGLRP